MAIRNILRESDPFLHKTCRPVEAFDERLAQLLDDMAETLHKADGVGLAAPQVGVCLLYTSCGCTRVPPVKRFWPGWAARPAVWLPWQAIKSAAVQRPGWPGSSG